jgi:hypothetical protein
VIVVVVGDEFSLPRERDPVLGRVQGMSLSSSEVDYKFLLYT